MMIASNVCHSAKIVGQGVLVLVKDHSRLRSSCLLSSRSHSGRVSAIQRYHRIMHCKYLPWRLPPFTPTFTLTHLTCLRTCIQLSWYKLSFSSLLLSPISSQFSSLYSLIRLEEPGYIFWYHRTYRLEWYPRPSMAWSCATSCLSDHSNGVRLASRTLHQQNMAAGRATWISLELLHLLLST